MPEATELLHGSFLYDRRIPTESATLLTTTDQAGQPVYRFWKELIRVGQFVHPVTKKKIPVTPTRLAHWYESGKRMVADGVRLPVNVDHLLSARNGLGEIKNFELRGDGLFGELEVVGDDARDLVNRNGTSCGLDDFKDGTGKLWKDVIYHVAVCQFPVITDLQNAIAASQNPAVGNAVFLSAEPTGDTRMPDPILTPEHIKTLRGCTHLCNMSGIADEGVPTALSAWHDKAEQQLSALRREIPGNCPPGDEIPRMTQHLSTLRHIKDKVSGSYPTLMSMNPGEAETAIDAKIEEWSNAAKRVTDLDSTVTELRKQNVELSAKVIKDVPTEATPFITEALAAKKAELCKAGFKPFAADALFNRFMSDGKPNAILCSTAANPFGTGRSLAFDLIDLIAQRIGNPATGALTGGQNLSRTAPSESLVDNEATKKVMAEMQK